MLALAGGSMLLQIMIVRDPPARQAHNLTVAGSNPAPATKLPRDIKVLASQHGSAGAFAAGLEAAWKQEGAKTRAPQKRFSAGTAQGSAPSTCVHI